MTNYDDYEEWVEVGDWDNEYYLQQYGQYDPDYLAGIFNGLILKAEANGLLGCHLKFQSNMESHGDCPDNPSVMVVGYRKHSVEEKEEIKERERASSFAKELGISFCEAKIVMDLKKRGKL